MKKTLTLICLVLVAVFAFAACSPAATDSAETAAEDTTAEDSTAAEEPAEEPAEDTTAAEEDAAPAEDTAAAEDDTAASDGDMAGKKFALIAKNTGNPYNEKQDEGFINAVEEAGGEAITRAPEQPTAEGQIAIIDELIAQNVDSICISANDFDALQPAAKKAMDAGIKVLSIDSATNPESRMTFINQAGVVEVAQSLCDAVLDMCGGEGEWAILSATSQASNQNAWIAAMEEIMAADEATYGNLELVKTAYGDDLRDKSVSETEALLQSYPDLKCIVAPTTVGIAAAGKVLTDKDLIGQVQLTGLGLPSEMAEYIDNGACEYMFLWNPIDVGYLGGWASVALVKGEITGAAGDTFEAGTLGEKTVTEASDGGTEVILGPPFRFDGTNIAEWKDVY